MGYSVCTFLLVDCRFPHDHSPLNNVDLLVHHVTCSHINIPKHIWSPGFDNEWKHRLCVTASLIPRPITLVLFCTTTAFMYVFLNNLVSDSTTSLRPARIRLLTSRPHARRREHALHGKRPGSDNGWRFGYFIFVPVSIGAMGHDG